MKSMDPMKNGCDDFVTVVAVGNQMKTENFVTVLSIGAAKNDTSSLSNGVDTNLEEEVEVFRLPGERLGFGLKFEGGNKTSERVKRLFVQSCADESPASRAKCSWGSLGEGDEILSIDGVQVMHMTRLDCVRRLKESQLVIKLLVRCRGALKPEVVSAERKSTPEKCKIPPELPAAPPPVPPRKLRHARGSADGEANPSPAKKNHKNSSPNIHQSSNVRTAGSTKCELYDSSNSSPKTPNINKNESVKKLSKECTPEFVKLKQEPPEAMVYLDARSQDGSSTHGSTSDETGSSMSTVVDRFSSSDRFSTTSTVSTTSEFPFDWSKERSDDQLEIDKAQLHEIPMKGILESFAQLDHDFSINSSDYLLKRLANSEAVTHVESRGEAGTVVEKITAVVAPNTVVIEETMTLQPPLSFQDAPLSYGHEARPGIFYTADLATDSTTHFRPIRDDISVIECINSDGEFAMQSNIDSNKNNSPELFSTVAPPLPVRNHVNCISVNQKSPEIVPILDSNISDKNISFNDTKQNISIPPKPLPRKDAKLKRKQLPPPPPPPNTTPRRELPPPVPARNLEISKPTIKPLDGNVIDVNDVAISPSLLQESKESNEIGLSSVSLRKNKFIESSSSSESFDIDQKQMDETIANESQINENNNFICDEAIKKIVTKDEQSSPIMAINKVFEIIEMRKVKALNDSLQNKKNESIIQNEFRAISSKNEITNKSPLKDNELNSSTITPAPRANKKILENKTYDAFEDNVDAVTLNKCINKIVSNKDEQQIELNDDDNSIETAPHQELKISEEIKIEHNNTDDETYQSLNLTMSDIKNFKSNNIINNEDLPQDESESSSDSDCDGNDYYWQSNLATIGEEEEATSLEYIGTDDQVNEIILRPDDTMKQSHASAVNEMDNMNVEDETELVKRITTNSKTTDKKADKNVVNGRMDNCGGGQRLPPDGDEFPAAYQEFSASSQQYQSLGAPRSTTTLLFNSENEMYNGKHTNGNLQTEESCVTTQYIITNSKEMTATEIVDDKNLHTQDIARRNTAHSTNIYSNLNNKSCSGPTIVLTEQTIEIAGYYPKETRIEMGGCGKDYPDSPPPPLPLTGPPKMVKPVLFTRSTSTDNSSRKFSLNSDLRRQDDKSEKSVRDKIAMFSSQSNLEAPLFPTSSITTIVTNTGRRLSKHKSTEDFFNEEKHPSHNDRTAIQTESTLSSPNLLDDTKINDATLVVEKYNTEISPTLPRSSSPEELTLSSSSITKNTSILPSTLPKLQCSSPTILSTDIKTIVNSSKPPVALSNLPQAEVKKLHDEPIITARSSMPTLIRATSFSGGISLNGDSSLNNNNNQISRTNSLASNFRRNSEDMRRTSLNQLIEQRKKGISKLRGLVIPEKDAVSIDQPIIDLPEIKSRDSILLHQMSKTNIQDKWGSQNSLASNTSTQSVPIKTSFKMPPPQIVPKYSPAFKRKTLAVYGSSNNTISSPATQQTSQMPVITPTEAPKSLESICSPTQSDYSFEYLSSSVSPENLRNRQRINQRKIRGDYDDSDNDSAVSSSQSSISRGFSPPTSPVPSERSNLSSERSYPTSMIMEIPARNYLINDRSQFNSKSAPYSSERTYQHGSTASFSDSSSGGSNSNSRSPPLESNSRYSTAIPQRELLKRSSSTETNYSTSSTLTSGSQASAESLSRRVLKPQSVEAINRKNILASARCRSGKNLNGSPLIQRKFSDEKVLPASSLSHENGNCTSSPTIITDNSDNSNNGEIKIAYVEMIDNLSDDTQNIEQKIEEPKLPLKKIISTPIIKLPSKPDIIVQPSNDLKMWVRTEAKALMTKNSYGQLTEKNNDETIVHGQCKTQRSKSSPTLDESIDSQDSKIKPPSFNNSPDINNIKSIEAQNEDLMETLTTRSRSRAPINLNENSILRSKNHMSLEDILSGKVTPQANRTDLQSVNIGSSHGKFSLNSCDIKSPTKINSKELSNDKTFISKIPTYGRQKINESLDEINNINERSKVSKIPMQKSLGRRSVSVTDMKRAIDKPDYSTSNLNSHGIQNTHHRFSSLDSNVGNHNCTINSEIDVERLYSDHFGSINSLASSTSLISQQELAQLVEEASLDDPKGFHDLIVVLLHKENPSGSVGITLAGGIDCETKEISVHRVLAHSIADKDGRIHRGDRILSINGRSTRGLSHRESLAILKQPRSEIVLVISRAKLNDGNKMRSRTDSVETIVEGSEANGIENTSWGPQIQLTIIKDGAGLGFSLEGGRDSPLGDKPLIVKKIFTGGAAEKTGELIAGDQLLEVNGIDVTRMSRIEAWSLMKKLHDGDVNLLVRHPATKSS